MSTNVFGISMSHCATACLIQDGKITGCVSEERFTRKKNCSGLPVQAISYLLDANHLNPDQIDLVVFYAKSPVAIGMEKNRKTMDYLYDLTGNLMFKFPFLQIIYKILYENVYHPIFYRKWKKEQYGRIEKLLGIGPEKILSPDHHLCHAIAPIYLYGLVNRELLILTCDGSGDGFCSSVSVFKNGKFTKIGENTPNSNTLAGLYGVVTTYLGMKPNEHEYKVMGLAPYADKMRVGETYKVLKQMVWLEDDLRFHSKMYDQVYYYHLKRHLDGHRFDWVAGAAQKLIEVLLTEWVKKAIRKTGIRQVAVGSFAK